MRALFACLAVGVILNAAERSPAQDLGGRFTQSVGSDSKTRRVRPDRTETDILIQQRAIHQARQRIARIQSRKWQGISLQRPHIGPAWSTGHGLNSLAWSPWGWYHTPGSLWYAGY